MPLAGGYRTLWLAVGCCLVTVLVPTLGWLAILGSLGGLALLRGEGKSFAGVPKAERWVLGLFMLSATVGLVTAYDPAGALRKYSVLAASCLLFLAISSLPKQGISLLITGSIAIGCLLGVYFLLSGDWLRWPADFELIGRVATRWQAFRPDLHLPPTHPNFVGGMLAMLMPIPLLEAVRSAVREPSQAWPPVAASTGMVVALLLTSSRGAWIALGTGLAAAVMTAGLQYRHRLQPWPLKRGAWLVVGVGMLAAVGGALLTFLRAGAAESGRLELYSNAIQLARDFFLTGGGLNAFAGLYSRYLLVIPDPFLEYGHNLFLDLVIEQGFIGLLALPILFLLALRRAVRAAVAGRGFDRSSTFALAVVAGLIVVLVHGLIDDPLYGQAANPLLLLVPALAGPAAAGTEPATAELGPATGRSTPRLARPLLALSLLAVVSAMVFWRPLASSSLADIGAVSMAKVDLRGWPQSRDLWGQPPYAAVMAAPFVRAIALDPNQAAAQYRLGLMAMADEDFDEAVLHLQAAHRRRPNHRGVLKSLGYATLWSGDIETATRLLRSIPEASQELSIYQWWWGERGHDDLAARASQAARDLEATP